MQIHPWALLFFFNDTPPTEIYPLSLHDALPISQGFRGTLADDDAGSHGIAGGHARHDRDRKSTRLNSSHAHISYAVFCLKKKTDRLHSHKKHHAAGGSLRVARTAGQQ